MEQQLFALGLFVFGFTMMFLMPAAQQKGWKDLGSKPPSGETVVMMMRFMGLLLIVIGFLVLLDVINIEAVVPNETKPHQ